MINLRKETVVKQEVPKVEPPQQETPESATVLQEFEKNTGTRTIVRLTEWKGKRYIDIRDWFKSKNEDKYIPTKKGISIRLEQFSSFLSILEQAEAQTQGAKK
jgi:hypothetical protein